MVVMIIVSGQYDYAIGYEPLQHCSQYVNDYSLSSSKTPWDELIGHHVVMMSAITSIYQPRITPSITNAFIEYPTDETPASTHGINCNNGLGIGTNGRGFDVDDEESYTP